MHMHDTRDGRAGTLSWHQQRFQACATVFSDARRPARRRIHFYRRDDTGYSQEQLKVHSSLQRDLETIDGVRFSHTDLPTLEFDLTDVTLLPAVVADILFAVAKHADCGQFIVHCAGVDTNFDRLRLSFSSRFGELGDAHTFHA